MDGEAERVVDRGQHRCQIVHWQERRSATAEKHRLHRQFSVAEHIACELDLGDRIARVRRLTRAATELGGRVGVEIAIATPGRAIGHVHVDAERRPTNPRPDFDRQRAIRGRRVAVRQGRWHADSLRDGSHDWRRAGGSAHIWPGKGGAGWPI